jgi:hypothetical protein
MENLLFKLEIREGDRKRELLTNDSTTYLISNQTQEYNLWFSLGGYESTCLLRAYIYINGKKSNSNPIELIPSHPELSSASQVISVSLNSPIEPSELRRHPRQNWVPMNVPSEGASVSVLLFTTAISVSPQLVAHLCGSSTRSLFNKLLKSPIELELLYKTSISVVDPRVARSQDILSSFAKENLKYLPSKLINSREVLWECLFELVGEGKSVEEIWTEINCLVGMQVVELERILGVVHASDIFKFCGEDQRRIKIELKGEDEEDEEDEEDQESGLNWEESDVEVPGFLDFERRKKRVKKEHEKAKEENSINSEVENIAEENRISFLNLFPSREVKNEVANNFKQEIRKEVNQPSGS